MNRMVSAAGPANPNAQRSCGTQAFAARPKPQVPAGRQAPIGPVPAERPCLHMANKCGASGHVGQNEREARRVSRLFAPFKLRDLEFRNRVFVSPMCQYSSPGGIPTDWHFVRLGSRAVGGAGLAMTEVSAISPEECVSKGISFQACYMYECGYHPWPRRRKAGVRCASALRARVCPSMSFCQVSMIAGGTPTPEAIAGHSSTAAST